MPLRRKWLWILVLIWVCAIGAHPGVARAEVKVLFQGVYAGNNRNEELTKHAAKFLEKKLGLSVELGPRRTVVPACTAVSLKNGLVGPGPDVVLLVTFEKSKNKLTLCLLDAKHDVPKKPTDSCAEGCSEATLRETLEGLIGRSVSPLLPASTTSVDSDGDKVPDSKDRCPSEPGPRENHGCPVVVVVDSDIDGIPDAQDGCPHEKGPKATRGCPDRDEDGVPDRLDECPDTPEGPRGIKGCPDSDGDGVVDIKNDCPDKPGSVEHAGCPDTDGDGLYDNEDRCRDVAGPKELSGCPDTDQDGVADLDDKCPSAAGPTLNHGCPRWTIPTAVALSLGGGLLIGLTAGLVAQDGRQVGVCDPVGFPNIDCTRHVSIPAVAVGFVLGGAMVVGGIGIGIYDWHSKKKGSKNVPTAGPMARGLGLSKLSVDRYPERH